MVEPLNTVFSQAAVDFVCCENRDLSVPKLDCTESVAMERGKEKRMENKRGDIIMGSDIP